jgi:hypothetical protein
VDAAIFNNNWGCKTGAAYGPIIKDELMRLVKVPTLTLHCDGLVACHPDWTAAV